MYGEGLRLRKLVTKRWLHVYPGLVSRGEGRRWRGYWNHYWYVGSEGRNKTARELPWEQNGLPPMVNIMRVALAKSRSIRGASHQAAFMGSCLTSMAPYDWANGGSVNVSLTW